MTVLPGGRSTVPESAAVILSMAAGADDEADLTALAEALATALPDKVLTAALDEAAWRVARLIDLCLARPATPAA